MITSAGMLKTTTCPINTERRFESCCPRHSNKREVNRWSMSVYHIQARFASTSVDENWHMGRWCNGSTAVSKTADEGSIPSLPAKE